MAGVATTTPYFAGFPIGVTSGSYSNTLDLTQSSSWNATYITANGGTTTSAESALIAAINADEAYLNTLWLFRVVKFGVSWSRFPNHPSLPLFASAAV